jgi:putative DNA modification/repair radical SAM protein
MEIERKIQILTDAAKYDVSCSSSGSGRRNIGGVGNARLAGICHSWADDGRCISLLKILQSNICSFNCAYCVNRKENDIPRASFAPRELADLAIEFYKRNYIEGLFLTSAVVKTADYTMEQMIETARILRQEMGFGGYIHMKAIPGASPILLERAGFLADRISINIELPSQKSLILLAPDKTKENILTPMGYIQKRREEGGLSRRRSLFVPAGQSTQMMVGASPESDRHIIRLASSLYRKFQMKRVYYSAYVPIVEDYRLPMPAQPPLWRENRLYQADWLLRFYGFQAEELLTKGDGNFSPYFDPKTQWALENLDFFPVEVNKADYEALLRVPGIGVLSAKRILVARKAHSLSLENLKKLGVVIKRAQHFITCTGRYGGSYSLNERVLAGVLAEGKKSYGSSGEVQMSLFNEIVSNPQTAYSVLTGHL